MSGRGSPAPGGREDRRRGGVWAGTSGVFKSRQEERRKKRSGGRVLSKREGGRCSRGSARGTLLSAGPPAAPQGLDHGTEPSCGDPTSGPKTAQ